jgi:hypothetical protein
LLLLIAVAGGVLSGIAITAPAIQVLDAGCSWARRCRIPSFVNLYHRIQKHRAAIVATLTRMAYGFTSTDNLIALCLLDRSGYCPPLPGEPPLERGLASWQGRLGRSSPCPRPL